MFGRRFFGRRYYGPRYFGGGGNLAPGTVKKNERRHFAAILAARGGMIWLALIARIALLDARF